MRLVSCSVGAAQPLPLMAATARNEKGRMARRSGGKKRIRASDDGSVQIGPTVWPSREATLAASASRKRRASRNRGSGTVEP